MNTEVKHVMSLICPMCSACEKRKLGLCPPLTLSTFRVLKTTYTKQLASKPLRTACNAVIVEKIQTLCAARERERGMITEK